MLHLVRSRVDGGLRTRLWAYVELSLLGLTACAAPIQTATAPHDRAPQWATSETLGGRLRFAHPPSWHVEDYSPQEGGYLTNFRLDDRCCDMQDGDIKIDFWVEASSVNSLPELVHQRCVADELSRPLSCRQMSVGGRAWGWVTAADAPHGATWTLTALTLEEREVVTAIAIIPAGRHEEAGLVMAEQIFSTLRLNTRPAHMDDPRQTSLSVLAS